MNYKPDKYFASKINFINKTLNFATRLGTSITQQTVVNADMAKLADAPDLGSGGAIHVGSTPIIRTNEYQARNKE